MKNLIKLIFLFSIYLSQTVTIYGLITDKETGESLIAANVFIENSDFGTFSDKNGFYSITLDNYSRQEIIVIQYLGYNTIKEKLIIPINNDIK